MELTNIGIESGNITGKTVGSLVSFFVPSNGLKIKNCYSKANIISLSDYDAGGLLAPGDKQFSYNISNSYFDGKINATYRTGPIKAMNENNNTDDLSKIKYTISNCYYNKEKFTITTNTPSTTGLTTSQFAEQSNFVGWDFENTWIMKDGRPELRIFVKD